MMDRRERLETERWQLENSYGNGPWHDGLIRQRIERIDRELRHKATDREGSK